MDFQGKTVLVFLEEDNIQRAYFRIRPLLTADEVVTPEALAAFPDDGYLRIVPDKNEQHTFKERMRTICGLCVVDLTDLPADAAKIRSNKNYAPQRGETNQFIIYSDAVRAMPERLLYQVVPEEEIPQAHTPFVYKRDGANILGPVRRSDGAFEGESVRLQPDSRDIHCVALPDGKELLFYWPAPPEKPAAPPVPTPAPAPLSAPAVIEQLNAPVVTPNANLLKPAAPERPAVETPAANYNGTKLYQGVARRAMPKRAYNPLIETVEQQRYAARYESPGAVLGDTASLRDVENPVEQFRAALQGVWNDPNTHQQTASIILSMSGMRSLLAKMVTSEHNDLAVAAMHSQLNDLEAERLMTLMRLDEAKKDLSALRKEALGLLTREEQAELSAVREDISVAKSSLDELKEQIQTLSAARDALADKLSEHPFRRVLSPALGGSATREDMIARVRKCFDASGFAVDEDDACAALMLFSLSENGMNIRADLIEDKELALKTFAHALGGIVCAPGNMETHAVRTADDAPVFIDFLSHRTMPSIADATVCSFDTYNEINTPVLSFTPKGDAFPAALPDCPPLSERAVRKTMLEGATELNEETLSFLRAVREALAAVNIRLPLRTAGKLRDFIAAAQNVMKGGVAAALDFGISAYVLPYIDPEKTDVAALTPLFTALPRTRKLLE